MSKSARGSLGAWERKRKGGRKRRERRDGEVGHPQKFSEVGAYGMD